MMLKMTPLDLDSHYPIWFWIDRKLQLNHLHYHSHEGHRVRMTMIRICPLMRMVHLFLNMNSIKASASCSRPLPASMQAMYFLVRIKNKRHRFSNNTVIFKIAGKNILAQNSCKFRQNRVFLVFGSLFLNSLPPFTRITKSRRFRRNIKNITILDL